MARRNTLLEQVFPSLWVGKPTLTSDTILVSNAGSWVRSIDEDHAWARFVRAVVLAQYAGDRCKPVAGSISVAPGYNLECAGTMQLSSNGRRMVFHTMNRSSILRNCTMLLKTNG